MYTIYMLQVATIVVPILVYLTAPWVVKYFGGKPEKNQWLLIVACALFFISWFLPSPLIDGEDTSFTTHFIGGGVFTGFLWLYLKYALNWRAVWWLEAFSLFTLVSALGAMNELFEWFIVVVGISTLTLADTSWDIAANTLGALVVYMGYLLYDSRHR